MYGIQPTLVSTLLYSLVHTPQVNLGRERCEVPSSKVHLLQSLWVSYRMYKQAFIHTPFPRLIRTQCQLSIRLRPPLIGLVWGRGPLAHMVCARTCVCVCVHPVSSRERGRARPARPRPEQQLLGKSTGFRRAFWSLSPPSVTFRRRLTHTHT